MMKRPVLVFAAGIAILTACNVFNHSTTETIPTQADVDRVQTKFPGYTLEDLNEGKKLYETNCALCHKLKKPSAESEEEWRKVVPPMVKKANGKNNNALDAKAEEKILRYVITMGPARK